MESIMTAGLPWWVQLRVVNIGVGGGPNIVSLVTPVTGWLSVVNTFGSVRPLVSSA